MTELERRYNLLEFLVKEALRDAGKKHVELSVGIILRKVFLHAKGSGGKYYFKSYELCRVNRTPGCLTRLDKWAEQYDHWLEKVLMDMEPDCEDNNA